MFYFVQVCVCLNPHEASEYAYFIVNASSPEEARRIIKTHAVSAKAIADGEAFGISKEGGETIDDAIYVSPLVLPAPSEAAEIDVFV